MPNELDTIRKQAKDIEEEAAMKAVAHFINGRRWERKNLQIGLPGAVLAGVAGVTAFTTLPGWITGAVAMVAGALSAINTFLNPGDKASSHRSSNATFSAIRRKADMVKDVQAPLADPDDPKAIEALVQTLQELNAEVTKAEQSASAGVSRTSLRQAREQLALNGESK